MNNVNNIVITGFMGTGKTTVGKILAEKLNRNYVDMDQVIEQRTGLTIPRIFAGYSERFFRAMEHGLAHELSMQTGLVISTGGGALVKADLREMMGNYGTLICLNASKDAIRERLTETDLRPLASDWERLFDERKDAYAQIKHQIDTTGKSPEQIAYEIIAITEQPIHVTTPTGGYHIWISGGVLDNIGQHLQALGLNSHAVIVTNETVAPLYGEQLKSKLPNADLITIPDGEEYKTLETVNRLYDQLIDTGADRNTTLIALGGGVIGDTAGYVAATYMRGIRLIQIPTTLLSMVDSSVGGKVGVDLPQGKNLVGAFKQPEVVIIDPKVLDTLPELQWRCGMAEVLKHGFIADTELLEPHMWEKAKVAELVRKAVQVKVDVVEVDPFERGIRAHLNLGHTFGHAIERVTNYQVPHGEAVAIGIMKAMQLSQRLDLIDGDLVGQIETILKQVGLPTDIKLDPEVWYVAMSTDKKWKAGKSRFVLLKGLGEATIVEGVPKEDVLAVLR